MFKRATDTGIFLLVVLDLSVYFVSLWYVGLCASPWDVHVFLFAFRHRT